MNKLFKFRNKNELGAQSLACHAKPVEGPGVIEYMVTNIWKAYLPITRVPV